MQFETRSDSPTTFETFKFCKIFVCLSCLYVVSVSVYCAFLFSNSLQSDRIIQYRRNCTNIFGRLKFLKD